MKFLTSKNSLAGLLGLALMFSQNAFAEAVQIKANGLTVNGDLQLADGKTLQDGVVLFTHGTWMNQDYSTAKMLKKNLTEAGQSVLAISLSLGMDNRKEIAMTSCDRPHTHKHTDALTEIDAWVKWLEKQGVKDITLVGHSRGGNQTAWYASLHNDDKAIKQVVLFAPQLWSWEDEVAEYQTKYQQDLNALVKKANDLVKAGKGDTLMPKTNFVYCKESPVSAASFADYYQNNPMMDTLHVLPNIQKPVLVFAGTDDKVVVDLPKKIEPILEAHNNIEVFEVDGADHFFLDFAGEDAVNHMNEFMAK
ncbi:alpha/beta hydrolase [Thiosulfativibrio zosterae]|uniref:AB hydrolase-1 domain-containing protein n=1 Tax=Thiosulfativibrio zosterae TaxID=2675053 RepID=A0A6F8PJQ6_9GAMM|nr:alpha/beta fold hydrolase [Thiosulfativibrio zosterae]BBP42294.1 hypothetical protein THMIRHAT_00400 [Thiosulfativibrio zosterae]